MKRFMIVVSLMIVLVCSSTSFAQIQAISVGGGLALPTGDFSNFAGTGYGATVRGFYMYQGLDNILLTGAVGFYPFGGKEYELFGFLTDYEWKWTVIPIMSGGRYYFGATDAKNRMYVGAEAGIHIYTLSLKDKNGETVSNATASGSTEFALLPVVGAQLGPLDVYAEYSLSEFNYFGVKGMFKFSVGKN